MDEDAETPSPRETSGSGTPVAPSDPRTVRIAIVGVLLVTVYAAVALLQILVLNPLAAAPGRSLDEILADLDAAGESLQPATAIGVLAVGVVLAVIAGAALSNAGAAPSVAALVYGILLALGAPAYFIASFGAGMSLADTYGISGADRAQGGAVLTTISGIALVVVFAIGVVTAARIRRVR